MTAKQPWILFWGIVVLVLLLAWSYAYPHDIHHPELNGWFMGLHSGKGPCCDGSEAVRIEDPDWDSKDGHYRVRIDGEWIDVPDEAVIKEPNLDGRTMAWPIRGYLGTTIRCFIIGAQG